MPHITSSMTVADGTEAGPVNRTFNPREVSIPASSFAYVRTAGEGRDKWVFCNVRWSDSTIKRPTLRQETETVFPVIRSVNGVDTVVATGRAVTTYVVPDAMTSVEVRDMFYLHRNFGGGSSVAAGVLSREPLW